VLIEETLDEINAKPLKIP